MELRCNDQRLSDQLRTRYHQYLASGTPHLVADVHWSGRSHPGYLADASMTFTDGMLHLAAPDYDGAVDVKQGRAWLQFSSTDPANDVEYFVRVCIALLAFEHGGMLFHAAGIARKGCGYLFFKLLELDQRLLRFVPVYRLYFLPDASFWSVVESR